MDQQTIKIIRSIGLLIVGILLFVSAWNENKPYLIYDYLKFATALLLMGYAIWNFINALGSVDE